MIIAIDPGRKDLAWAILTNDGELFDCGLSANPKGHYKDAEAWRAGALALYKDLSDYHKGFDVLVLEVPQVYQPSPVPPDDLLQLVGMLGALCTVLSWRETKAYRPREWKGQVPKRVSHARIHKRLTVEETSTLNACLLDIAEGLRHNVLDAVGIALKYAGRY